MPLPAITGQIRRRILLNFRARPELIQPLLPPPFRPTTVDGWAIAGICLIRLEQIRPKGLPGALGLSSENAAHRIAVTWSEPNGQERDGVYIFRRDSNSPLNQLAGGRLVSGVHGRAKFEVTEGSNSLQFSIRTQDGAGDLDLQIERAIDLDHSSIFPSIETASAFFQRGADGYSPDLAGEHLQGIRLEIPNWAAKPLRLIDVHSAYYQGGRHFPPGAVQYDSTLLMEDLAHTWRTLPDLPTCCTG